MKRKGDIAMQLLKERILKDGVVKPGNILKVDSFLNHQMDIDLINEIGKEFKARFSDCPITKILTIEASGIGIACIVAQHFNVPVVFAKKKKPSTMDNMLTTEVFSFTKNRAYTVCCSKDFLGKGDKVLFIDDFLANGNAAKGIIDLVKQAGAELSGMGFIVEKSFQHGGDFLRESGYQVESLAIIDSLDDCKITFKEKDKE